MAVTADIVEVRLEADTRSYISNLSAASSATLEQASSQKELASVTTARAVATQRAAQADLAALRATEGVTREQIAAAKATRDKATASTAAARAAQADANALFLEARAASESRGSLLAAASAATQVQTSAAGANLQVGNIAAQFQDIGVTAASGMNPLIIALQQGTQLSAVLNQSVQSGVSPVRALGAAFVQILNPISLGTIAIIALGTAAAQYLGSLISQGQVSEETLKKQADLIREVADNWGDAVPALRAYVDQLDRAEEVGNLNTATDLAIEKQYAALISTVENLRAEFAAARVDIQQLGGDAQEIDALQAAFDELERKARANEDVSADLERVISLLGSTSVGTSANITALRGVLGGLAGAFAQAEQAARTFREQRDAALAPTAQVEAFNSNREFIAEQARLNALTGEQLALENEINRVKASAERSDVPISDAQALTVATENLAAAERRRAEAKALLDANKAGTREQTEADREADAVLKLIEQLRFEYDLVSLTNEERAVANALRQAGAAATAEQRDEIEALVTATLAEREALAQLDETTQMWAQTAQDATRGFIDDLIAGKSAAEALGNVFKNLGSQLINLGLTSLLGGQGGGLLGGLISGRRANGGPVNGGSTYLVGERGPELFTPSSAGRITSNADMQGGGGFTFAPVIDARGADVAAVARLESSLRQLAGNMVPTIRKEIAQGPKKGRRV